MVATLISREFLNPDVDVAIGRFVLYPEQPHFSFFDPATAAPTPNSESALPPLPTVAVTPQKNYSQVLKETKSAGLQGTLSRIGLLALRNNHQDETHIEALAARSYRLNNSDEWFDGAVARSASRRWLNKMIIERKQTVFLVVGYRTLFDASVRLNARKEVEMEGEASVPVADILGAGVATLLGGLGDMGGNITFQYGRDQGRKFVAPGEQVYAIEYRKVKLTLFARRNLDRAMLDAKSHWEVLADLRGEGDAEDEDDVRVVEAQVVDELGKDDLSPWSSLDDGEDHMYFSEGDDQA